MEKTYLTEAFKALEELNEEVFDISFESGLEDAKEFAEEPVDDREEEIIIDPLAETEEELEKDYLGKAILQCEICKSMIYKDPSEVVIDEEAELANVDEVCPICQSQDGFKVIGEIKEFCDNCEECECEEHSEEEPKEEVEETEEEKVEIEEKPEEEKKEESLEEFLEPIDSFKEFTFIEKTKDGFEIKKVYKDLDDNRMHIIAYRPKRDDYLIGLGYSPETGEWNQGMYDFVTEIEAEDELEANYNVEEFELTESIKTRKKVRTEELKESSELDKIDAEADNKKEEAEAEKEKVDDDADADRDEEKKELKESDKPAAVSMEDAQKWVDFDMKRYGKISERTNRLVKKAGFQILKDDHGDYEVAAGKFESCEESLKEDFSKVDIETDREKMSMTADENGKVTVTTEPKTEEVVSEVEEKTEVIAPVTDEVKAEFKSEDEEEIEEPEFTDVEFDEFEEKDFDELGESYLKRVYENVDGFKTTSGTIQGNNLKLEGLITFKSGKTAKTEFVFEAFNATKTGKLKFIGENKQFAKGKKSFTLTGKADGKKLVCESLTYNYVGKSADGESKRLYGTVKR